MNPSPETTLVIILGASDFPGAPQLSANEAFKNSAADFKHYLLNKDGFALPVANLLNLFDSPAPVEMQDNEIGAFLRARSKDLEGSQNPARDLIIYYVGHGGFFTPGDQYFLALRNTKEGSEIISGYPIYVLANQLKENATHLRRFLILDCCFAATAYQAFQSGPLEVAKQKTLEELPSKGTALLCASGPRDPAKAPPGLRHTMFSGALLDVLRKGSDNLPTRLSFLDVGRTTQALIRERFIDRAVRPQIASPDQSYGDVSTLPFFPNLNDSFREKYSALNTAAQKAIADEDWGTAIEALQALVDFDPSDDKPKAELADAKKQKVIADLYANGQVHLAEGRLQEALECFREVESKNANYKNVTDLAAQVRTRITEEKVEALFKRAQSAMKDEQWDVAIESLQSLLDVKPHHAPAEDLLRSARQQKQAEASQVQARITEERVEALFKRAQSAIKDEQWDVAIESLQSLLEVKPNHAPAEDLLKSARQQKQLAEFYSEALSLYESGQWNKTLEKLREVKLIASNYKDVDEYFSNAQQKLCEETKNTALRLYDEIQVTKPSDDWGAYLQKFQATIDALQAGHKLAPEDPDLSNRLSDARNQFLPILYTLGKHHYRAGDWDWALKRFESVYAIDNDYKNVRDYINNARKYRQYNARPFYTLSNVMVFGLKALVQLGIAIASFYGAAAAFHDSSRFGEYSAEYDNARGQACGAIFLGLVLLPFGINNLRKIVYAVLRKMDPYNTESSDKIK